MSDSSSGSSSSTSRSARTSGSSASTSPSSSSSAALTSSNGTTASPTVDPSSTSGRTFNSSGPFFPSPTGDPPASSTQNPGGLGPPSSSLYLFTFLATLFLLLAISSAIIMRGIFLRRRFRRRLEEAIAAGVLLSPDDGSGGPGGRAHRRRLQRPTMFDVSVLPPYFSSSSPQDGSWEKVMPFSGSVHSEKPEARDPSAVDTDASSSVNNSRSREPRFRSLFEGAAYVLPRNRRNRNGTSTRPNASTAASTPSTSDEQPPIPLKERRDPVQRAVEVRVAVVIAMPNPHRSAYVPPSVDEELHQLSPGGKGKARGLDVWGDEADEEAGVPDVILGFANVPVIPSSPPSPSDEKEQAS